MQVKQDCFTWLAVRPMRKGHTTFYQARLTQRLGRRSIGLGTDYPLAVTIASAIDNQIEQWVKIGQPIDLDFLKALAKEKKEKKKAESGVNLRIVEKDDLSLLWDKYVSFHIATKAWEETYVVTHIQTVGNLIKRCPFQKLEQKQDVVEWLFSSKKRSPKTSKARFKLIVACVDWNSKQGNIPRHWGIEYRDTLESIEIEKRAKKEDDEIDILKVSEVYQILNALKNDTFSRFHGKHSQYFKYCYFLWLTGCRPSEAIALKWENVTPQKIMFCEGEVYTSGQNIKKQGTKTEVSRIFPINGELKDLLDSIPHKTGYVFLRNNGKAISHQSFRRVWKLILTSLGLRYRKPYQLRHSMISYHANNDFPIHKLAELVGNSDEVIKEHYLQLDIERITLPSIIH